MTKIMYLPRATLVSGIKDNIKNISVKEASVVLGKDRVYSAIDVGQVWGEKNKEPITTYYLLETLEQCAKENVAGKADWRLVYCLSSSPSKMLAIRGEGNKGEPCFHPTYNFYPDLFYELNTMHSYYTEERSWIMESKKLGYRLIDFKPRFHGLSFAEQERCIRGMGEIFFRTEAAIFIETVMNIFMVSGLRIAEGWFHWADEKYDGYHVAIGRFIPYGLLIMPGYEGSRHGVVISRGRDYD